MSGQNPGFDKGFFGEDYAYFYEHVQLPERAEREADVLMRLLKASAGDQVVDAACGYGRIACRLASRGVRVLGIDESDVLLSRARELADAMGVNQNAEFKRADLRELKLPPVYDGAICWFSSFGFYSEEDDRAILRRLARAIQPGGRLAMEILGRASALESLSVDRSMPVVVSELGEDAIVDRVRLSEDKTHVVLRRVITRGDRVRRMKISIRAFEFDQISDWLVDAGFADVQRYEIPEDESDLFTRASLIVVATS